nr:hypothetical protein Iba_chr04bCG0930 [Ipomoea batatas]
MEQHFFMKWETILMKKWLRIMQQTWTRCYVSFDLLLMVVPLSPLRIFSRSLPAISTLNIGKSLMRRRIPMAWFYLDGLQFWRVRTKIRQHMTTGQVRLLLLKLPLWMPTRMMTWKFFQQAVQFLLERKESRVTPTPTPRERWKNWMMMGMGLLCSMGTPMVARRSGFNNMIFQDDIY